MLWWQWVIGGLLLLGAELGFVVADFYLVFIGLSAALVGVVLLIGVPLSVSIQWMLFALIAILSLVLFRTNVYRYFRHPAQPVVLHLLGEVVTLPVECQPFSTISVEVKGAYWPIRHREPELLPAGTQVKVVELDGLTLVVEPLIAPTL